MSVFAMDMTELVRRVHVSLELSILPWSASEEDSIAASSKYETEVRVLSGFECVARAHPRNAVALFSEALSLDHSCVQAFVGRAIAHEQMRDHEQAYRDYDHALQLDQRCVLALCRRGWTGLALNQSQAALNDCTNAVSLAPNGCASRNNLGSARAIAGNMTGALVEYDKALSLAKSNDERTTVLTNRGTLLCVQGLWERAASDLQAGIDMCDDYPGWASLLLWHCLARMENRAAGDATLGDFLLSHKRESKCASDDWLTALGELLLGRISEEVLLSMIETNEPYQTRERYCEAHFHIGCLAVLHGHAQTARKHLRWCLGTDVVLAPECVCARAELSRLEEHSFATDRPLRNIRTRKPEVVQDARRIAMSTRCLTFFETPEEKVVAAMYRHHDGYPEGHGFDLGSFLLRTKVNDIEKLATDTAKFFKREGCYIELLPPGERLRNIEFEYYVAKEANGSSRIKLRVCCLGTNESTTLYEGDARTFLKWIEKGWPALDWYAQ